MDFKQHHDGMIEAKFMPSDLPMIVRAVKVSEQRRLEMLKTASKVLLKTITKAERELATEPNAEAAAGSPQS